MITLCNGRLIVYLGAAGEYAVSVDDEKAAIEEFRVAVYGEDWRQQPGAVMDSSHTLLGIRAAVLALLGDG